MRIWRFHPSAQATELLLGHDRKLGFAHADWGSDVHCVVGGTVIVDVHVNRLGRRRIGEGRTHNLFDCDVGGGQRLVSSLHIPNRFEAAATHGERTAHQKGEHQQHDQSDDERRALLITVRSPHDHGVSLRPETLTRRAVVE
ncbi:hypothetical protein D3C84_1009150 [compost metagenome]